MWSGGKDGDTHSPLDRDESMAHLCSHTEDAARITGERFEWGTYIERIYLDAKRGWSESERESPTRKTRYGGKRLKIRPDHGALIVVGGVTNHSWNVGKRHTGRRGAGFPIARKKEGAQSATTNDPACNTEQNGPETGSTV